MNQSWKQKRALILGMGISGKGAAAFLLKRGASVIGVDRNPFPDQFEIKNEKDRIDLSQVDTLVISPGIPPGHPLCLEAKRKKIPIIGEAELALQSSKSPTIGITGTNGKTTVALMLEHILNHCHIKAKAVGNIGESLAIEVDAAGPETTLVAELSSYQLETMEHQSLNHAALLNMTPDHLDRYPSFKEYTEAKGRIVGCLKTGGTLAVSQKTLQAFPDLFEHAPVCSFGFDHSCQCYSDGEYLIYKEKLEFLLPNQYRMVFSHDVENMLAAYCICRSCNIKPEPFFEALGPFAKPAHRLEFVRNVDGVAYYNDSKGTNIDAVVRAVEAMKGNTILIAGGVDKGAAYTPWRDAFRGKVKCVYTIGEARKTIKRDLEDIVMVEMCLSLEEAVSRAQRRAVPGENILLSPGCSSFDMFENYSHRGNRFKQIVNDLISRSFA